MHIVETPSSPVVEPASSKNKPRVISEGNTNGLMWMVYSDPLSGDFFFRVIGPEGPLVESPAEHSTAPKAERAARAWCDQWSPEPASDSVSEPAETEPQPEQPADVEREASAVVTSLLAHARVGGWDLRVKDDRGGTYQVEVVDADTGEIADLGFTGYQRSVDALSDAKAWAAANPSPSERARRGGPVDDTAQVSEAAAETGEVAETGEAAETEVLNPTGSDVAAIDTKPEPETWDPETKAHFERELLGSAAPAEQRDWSTVDEVWTLLAQRDEVDDRLALAEAAKQRAAAQAKEIRAELEELDARIRVARNNAERQRVLPLHPAPRQATQTQAGEAAKWAFNGVEFQIEQQVEQTADGERVTTWLKGHREKTEGHGFTLVQAIEATQNAASIAFADAEPGSTAASSGGGPVADAGARKPAKRKPSKLKGHDQAAVIAAVEKNLTIPEAAMELGCTPQQLEAYAEKAGLVLSKHQGRTAGEELPPAPAAKVSKAARGKRAKRGGK